MKQFDCSPPVDERASPVVMAFVSSFLVYLVLTAANGHVILPWGGLVGFLFGASDNAQCTIAMATLDVVVQGLAGLYFYGFLHSAQRRGRAFAIALPIFFLIFPMVVGIVAGAATHLRVCDSVRKSFWM